MYRPRAGNPHKVVMSLGGMYEYDNTIFDDAVIPDGMDKAQLVTTILAECGENETRWSNPFVLKKMIENFFYTRQYKYTKLWESTQLEYDPLENYNLTIEVSRGTQGLDKTNRTVESESTTEGSNENQRSAFDSVSYQPNEKDTGSSTVKGGGTENETFDTTRNEAEQRHEFGDNSARSSMDNIRQQRAIVDFNIYQVIALEFEDQITIPVYDRMYTNIFEGGC